MNLKEESLTVQISVDVSDQMRCEAESRGLPIIVTSNYWSKRAARPWGKERSFQMRSSEFAP